VDSRLDWCKKHRIETLARLTSGRAAAVRKVAFLATNQDDNLLGRYLPLLRIHLCERQHDPTDHVNPRRLTGPSRYHTEDPLSLGRRTGPNDCFELVAGVKSHPLPPLQGCGVCTRPVQRG
jgi:hypothetical protein